MSKAERRRRRLGAHRRAAASSLAAEGVPAFAPTPERLRHGRVRLEPLIETAPSPAPAHDWTGDRRDTRPRKVLMGHVRRDLMSGVGFRLSRFKALSAAQVRAAERMERDWAIARLEPRMTADLGSAGIGGRRPDAAVETRAEVIDARERLHGARAALRRGGEEVLRVVEAVVIFEATADRVGAPAYSARRDASVYVRTLLGIGLNLLADWYRDPASRVR
jgi:hypothetical protein